MKDIPCPFCSKHNDKFIYPSIADAASVEGFNYVYCSNCKIAYLNPTPEDKDVHEYYSRRKNIHDPFQNVDEYKIDRLRQRIIDHLRLSKSEDRILDIGCGKGEVLYCLLKEGYDAEGVEPYFRGSEQAPILNEKIHKQNLTDIGFPDGHFSLATMWSSLEHIAEPLSLLEEAARVIKPGGRFAVSVPNFNTSQHKLLKDSWPGFGPPAHLFVYSDSGLKKILKKFGFEAQKQFFDPAFDQWMLKNSVYNFLLARKNKISEAVSPASSMSKTERSVVSALSFPFVRIEALLGRSSYTHIVFRKN